jgi:aryl-alcohol dehydrogenase-like predicted oxidoreductase
MALCRELSSSTTYFWFRVNITNLYHRPDEERFKILDRAWELGATFWDTSQEHGDNEILIGKWLAKHRERRQDIFLATKFGVAWK